MNEFRTRDPVFAKNAHEKLHIPYANKYLDTWKTRVGDYAKMNERWGDQASFHRWQANKAVSDQHSDPYFDERKARISEGQAKALKEVTSARAKSHNKFVSMMEGQAKALKEVTSAREKSHNRFISMMEGGSRRRNKKSKNSKKRSNKSRKNHRRK